MLVALLHRLLEALTSPEGRSRTRAAGRLGLLLGAVLALCLLPLPLTPGVARWWAPALLGGGGFLLLAGAGLLHHLSEVLRENYTQHPELRLLGGRLRLPKPQLDDEARRGELGLVALRRAGMAVPALLFFCAWALIYITAWAWDPALCPADPTSRCAGAFGGVPAQPIFGDFLYLSVNMAFANPAPDLLARSRLTHALGTVEVISGIGLATLYASSFFGLGRGESRPSS